MIDLTTTDLNAKTAVELRKVGAEAGIKGASKGKKADLLAALLPIQEAQIAEAAKATKTTKAGRCTECGAKEDFRASGLCAADREYAEWENAHSDESHEDDTVLADGCPVCHPELDPRKVAKTGRSRMGMVIVAKGSEIHKSMTFKAAAEAKGWTVEIARETYELGEGATGEGTRFYATATKGSDSISLAWDGRAYDYPASSAKINGKDRKVRNLKEALRLI